MTSLSFVLIDISIVVPAHEQSACRDILTRVEMFLWCCCLFWKAPLRSPLQFERMY
jgi:hypothetical protein